MFALIKKGLKMIKMKYKGTLVVASVKWLFFPFFALLLSFTLDCKLLINGESIIYAMIKEWQGVI